MRFAEWIDTQIQKRGWSRKEFSKRGKISPSMTDQVITGASEPGLKFFRAVSLAFEISMLEAMGRYTGDWKDNPQDVEEWSLILRQLDVRDREELLHLAKVKAQMHQGETPPPPAPTKVKKHKAGEIDPALTVK